MAGQSCIVRCVPGKRRFLFQDNWGNRGHWGSRRNYKGDLNIWPAGWGSESETSWAVENKHHTSIHWGYRIILSPKVPTRLGDFRDILNNTYSHVKVKWSESCSVVSHFAVPWMVAHQASLSMEFSKTEYWRGLPYPPPGDLPDPGIKPGSPTLQTDSLTMWATGEDHIFSRVQLGNPLDCSLPGSSVHGIFQTRILEWLGHFLSKISLSICSIEQLCHTAPPPMVHLDNGAFRNYNYTSINRFPKSHYCPNEPWWGSMTELLYRTNR